MSDIKMEKPQETTRSIDPQEWEAVQGYLKALTDRMQPGSNFSCEPKRIIAKVTNPDSGFELRFIVLAADGYVSISAFSQFILADLIRGIFIRNAAELSWLLQRLSFVGSAIPQWPQVVSQLLPEQASQYPTLTASR